MAWVYLLLAALFEIGWPLGFKLSQQAEYRVSGVAGAIVSMGLSGWLLWLAQREIPIGTAYAVWTGGSVAAVTVVGVYLFGEPATLLRIGSILLILIGMVGLRLDGVDP